RRLTICSTSLLAFALSGCAGSGQKSLSLPADTSGTPTTASVETRGKKLLAFQTISFRKEEDGSDSQQDDSDEAASKQDVSQNDELALETASLGGALGMPEAVSEVNLPPAESIEPQTSYTLADIEQLALNNNPSIAAAISNSNKAAGLRRQVGVRPNPTLGYAGQQLADENTDQHIVFIEQEFVRGGKLSHNQAVLSHTTAAQRAEIETQRHRVLTDIRVRFFEALAAQQGLDATREFEAVARRGVQVAMDRKEAEEGTLIEVLQSKTLLSEITLAAERTEADFLGAWKDLAAIAGLPESSPARLAAELSTPDSPLDWNVAYGEIIAQSPELAVANALVCEKSALLKRQQVQMVPNITGQLGAGYDNGTDSGMINLQVTAPIPVWNKNQGNISAAYADYTRAVQNVTRIEQGIRSRLARAAQSFDASMASVKKYEQEIMPQASQSLELSEEAYRAGELDFLQVLIVRRSFYESMIRFIEVKGELAQASAKVDGLLLSGGLDAPQDYTDGDGIRGASFGGQ
ncbi:MAG: TolC family protein, partial [Pirellulaceae bacterium]